MTRVIVTSGIRPLVRADVAQVARMHADALPASLLSALGQPVLEQYYAFVAWPDRPRPSAGSRPERAWVVVDGEDNLVGACVLSDEPGSLLQRFARYAPVSLGRALLTQLVRNRTLRTRVAHRLRERGGDVPHAPEVTQIFTDRRVRGSGFGGRLLRACEAHLRTRGVRSYFVHTERDDNDAGIRFYRREGFVTIGESRSFGQAFLVMQKDLD
jgi:GNAT superfamily N-acetyltransferase